MFFTRYQIMRDVWTDAEASRQLVEHFQGNLILSRLELSVIALRSFYSRNRGFKYPGDREYALMGLLRQRVPVNPDHTEFEAFASLSLLADSDSLLERLFCIQPKSRNQRWDEMDDAYGAKLWDIYPSCQISGVGHGHPSQSKDQIQVAMNDQLRNTVIIDGLFGASVRWKSFQRVYTAHRISFIRNIAQFLLDWSSYITIGGIALIAVAASSSTGGGDDEFGVSSGPNPSLIIPGVLFLICGLIGLIFTPELLLKRYGGKKWSNQPWLFGIEGYCDIGEIEAKLFGTNEGHLKWDPFGSPLSRHEPNEYGEVEGINPMSHADVRDYVRQVRERGETRVSIPRR
jgi:hypothetical protein